MGAQNTGYDKLSNVKCLKSFASTVLRSWTFKYIRRAAYVCPESSFSHQLLLAYFVRITTTPTGEVYRTV